MARVAVVGAGIAGLGAAYALQQAGQEVIVLEERGAPGGRMLTRSEQGFTWDPGAQFMLSDYRYMTRLMGGLGLTMSSRPIPPVQGIPLPGKGMYYSNMKSPFSVLRHPLLSAGAKWRLTRLMRETWRHRRQIDFHHPELAAPLDQESLRAWGDRAIGKDAVDYFLSVPFSTLFFWRPEETPFWSMLLLMRMMSQWQVQVPEGGMGAVPAALARRLDVRLRTAVRRVEALPDGTVRLALESSAAPGAGAGTAGQGGTRSELTVDRVVLAVPAPAMLAMLPDPEAALGPARAGYLRSVRYAPCTVAAVAYRQPWETRAYGVGVPLALDSPLAAVGWEHMKAPGRTSAGSGLGIVMSTAAFAARHGDQSEEELAQALLRGADSFYPGSADDALFTRIYRWQQAIPVPEPGQTRRMAEAIAAGPAPGSPIFPCGDAWFGPNTELALGSGWRAAAEVLRSLGQPVPPELSL